VGLSSPIKSRHIEPSTLKKQHLKAIAEGTRILREETKKQGVEVALFKLYTLRHTCLTRRAPRSTRGHWHISQVTAK